MKYFFFLLFFSISTASFSQQSKVQDQNASYVPVSVELYNTILKMDSTLFEAFNKRDIVQLQNFFSDSLEIYQDNVGVRNYSQTIAAFKDLFTKDYILTRTLIKSTMEVYPIKDYGAIQTGQHTFCHTENGKLECGTFKFLHIWEKINDQWKITRIITYNH